MTVGLGVLAPVAPRALPRRRVTHLANTPSRPEPTKQVLPSSAPAVAEGETDEALVMICQGARVPTAAEQQERERAFRVLVERYEDRAYWIAKGMIGHADDARDVAQDAFIRVFRSVDRFDPNLRFYTWFYQIVVNLSIDHLRRRKKRARLSLEDLGENGEGQIEGRSESPSAAVEHDELQRRVARVLAELPEKYRSVIMLRDLEGFDGKEVADMSDATHATVRWRLHKARQMFREAWERIYGARP